MEPSRSGPAAATTWGRSASGSIASRGLSRPAPSKAGWKDAPAMKLEVGDRVTHDKYGLGRVVAVDGAGLRATATIDFGGSGTVRLMLIGSVPMTKI